MGHPNTAERHYADPPDEGFVEMSASTHGDDKWLARWRFTFSFFFKWCPIIELLSRIKRINTTSTNWKRVSGAVKNLFVPCPFEQTEVIGKVLMLINDSRMNKQKSTLSMSQFGSSPGILFNEKHRNQSKKLAKKWSQESREKIFSHTSWADGKSVLVSRAAEQQKKTQPRHSRSSKRR